MEAVSKILELSPMFMGLNELSIDNLLRGIHHQVKHYKRGDIVAFSGDECKSLQIVVEGNVKGEMMDMAGHVLKIEDIGVPRPLAVAFLFGQNNRYPVTITANVDTTILVIPRQSVIKLIQTSEVFLTNFMNAVSNRAQFITKKLKFHSFQSLRGKLADYLLCEAADKNGIINLTKTQEELAELFGVARPSLSRTLRELHNEGLIKADGKRIVIINKVGLKECIEK